MPYNATDNVSSVSGRNSRTSVISGTMRTSHTRSPPPGVPPNDTLSNAGILSMLKTTTDTGDIGSLSFNTGRLPTVPRATHQRRGHASRSSQHNVSSNHSYAPSQNSRVSSQWDNASMNQRRGSLSSMQSIPPMGHLGKPPLGPMPPTPDDRDLRSFSMTSAPGQPLPRHRSATSLRSQPSQGHGSRNSNRMPPGPVPPMPDNRAFVYPTRLKRPGYRSPSPALSDGYAPPMPGMPPSGRRQPVAGPHPPQVQHYHAYGPDYGPYGPEAAQLGVRPPPRAANSSPGPGYAPNPYSYRSGPMRPAPAPGMPPPMAQPMMPPQHQMQPPPGHYAPQPAYYGPPRPAYAPYGPPQHPGYRGPPPQANAAPVAHHKFHNAARMARMMPHRTDTPLNEGTPSGSDPASSSAPTSSNPPTPKDNTLIQVSVDPAFINPDFVDLPESSSEPVLPAKYFDYADGLEKAVHEPDMEVPHPSVPAHTGFVQRVRAMLESKAAAEAAARHEHEKANRQYGGELDVDHDNEEVSDLVEYHELAANETPRFTLIEEFDAPVELPASPVKLPELEALEAPQPQRQSQPITREMIKAELGPSSADNTQMQVDDTTTHLMMQLSKQYHEEGQQEQAAAEQARIEEEARVAAEQDLNRHNSVADTITTTDSVPATLPTGIDYAMRFSRTIDTTVASEETQSRDHFALDADTATLQEQSSKQISKEQLSDIKEFPTPEPSPQAVPDRSPDRTPVNPELDRYMDRTPVSSIHPGEEITRNSAVSPVQTQTLNIDETLEAASGSKTDSSNSDTRSEPESLQVDDSHPPPTPRTPKTYSKSVQLRPRATVTDSNSTNTNRFSLPGDISTVGDTTIDSASDMITDVAVRFSLPHGSISIGKPQIIEVSPSSTPDSKPKQEFFMSEHNGVGTDMKTARRNSVTFIDDIAPLNIKKAEVARTLQSSAEAAANKGKSIIRKPSPATTDSSVTSRDVGPDFRLSAAKNPSSQHARFGSTHLPGLKEESVEDMSISDHKRTSSGHQMALPARIAAVKAMQERRLQESGDKAKARRQARQHNRPLGETRDLPSLNFSRTDLIDRLNEALELTSIPKDVVRRRDFTGIYCPSPQRPTSTEPLRDRYTSFFSKPEEFSFAEQPDDGDVDSEIEEPSEHEQDDDKALVPALQIQETTEVEGVEPGQRPLSPEDFLNVAQQASRLSIPNVGGLSDRLSELIPGLRNLSNFQLDSIFKADRESLHRLSTELVRPDTVMTNRTSAGFRTLAERAEQIVKNRTHDSIAPRLSIASLNKELPPLPESASADGLPPTSSPDGKQSYLSGSKSAPSELGVSVVRPASAMLRGPAPKTEEEVLQMLPKEANPITRNGKRSLITSQTSRPWNNDENYPWGSKVDIDLSVPSTAHTRNSMTSEVLRRTKSLDLTSVIERSAEGIDIGSITLPSSASINTEQLTGIPSHKRDHSKRSIIGSISKKFKTGLSGKSSDDEKNLGKSPLGRETSVTRQSNTSHKPGDRYPTSALTPPASFNLDEVRSFFSDNSSERDRTASFRKRLTGFNKGKNKHHVRIDQHRGRSFDDNTAYDGGSMAEARLGAGSRARTYDGVGMSKTEFHIKRFGEKLRNLFARGGELIRSFSTSKKKKPERGGPLQSDEWLADSLYSGV